MDVSINEHNHDEFLEQFPLGSFLQSRFWKSFLTRQGKKNWQLSVYDENRLIANCVLYATKLPLGKSYLYAPKGPLILPTLSQEERTEALGLILSQIRDITIATRRREEIFCRIEPNIMPADSADSFRQVEARTPQTTMYLDLDEGSDKIFSSLKEKTRYNIRLAERKGVTLTWSSSDNDLKIFMGLLSKSARRKRIRSHDRCYYRMLLETAREFDAAHIAIAYDGKHAIAANMYIMHYPTITYLHGGFDYAHRNLMAPYLLHWSAIKRAYAADYGYYDLWGYTPRDGSKSLWAGFSRFKAGFSGRIVESPGCFDFIYNPLWYKIYDTYRRGSRILRLA